MSFQAWEQSHPLVSLMMSPGWMRLPSSSQTEMAMLPLLSATLHERTSWPSFVLVTRPNGGRATVRLHIKKKGGIDLVKSKRHLSAGPFKTNRHELMVCGDMSRRLTTYLFPTRWIQYSNFSSQASHPLAKTRPRLWGLPLFVATRNTHWTPLSCHLNSLEGCAGLPILSNGRAATLALA